MHRCNREPTLHEALADPLVRALMVADGVDPNDLERRLGAVARRGRQRRETK